jgi:hypothetical protein
MSKNQLEPHADQLPSSNKTDVEAVARDTGATEEQVAQLARVNEDGADLEDAAAAAARWS